MRGQEQLQQALFASGCPAGRRGARAAGQDSGNMHLQRHASACTLTSKQSNGILGPTPAHHSSHWLKAWGRQIISCASSVLSTGGEGTATHHHACTVSALQ